MNFGLMVAWAFLIFLATLAGMLLGLLIVTFLEDEHRLTLLLVLGIPFLMGCGVVVVSKWMNAG